MSLFYITVPAKAYEVELRIKELGHPEIYVENGVMEDLNERFLYDENDVRIAKDPERFVLRCPHAKVWDVIVAEDYMVIHNRRGSNEVHDFDEQIKAEIHKYFLEKHLTDTLERFGIADALPSNSLDFRVAQALFCVPAAETDEIISRFQFVGIGSTYGSTLTVCQAQVYYGPDPEDENQTPFPDDRTGDGKDEKPKESNWTHFVKSIKSRLTVAQVVSEIRTSAVLTFDFLMLTLVASVLAVLGLLENSTVITVAAMLISPMRGPLMAFTFGTVIRDLNLVVIGGRNELIALFLCMMTGYIAGLMLGFEAFAGPWHDIEQWPTTEMIARGRVRDIVMGAYFAVPSGVGLALSILAGNEGCLVGLALSAALMIPAVDCGMFWGLGTAAWVREGVHSQVWYQHCTLSGGNQTRTNFGRYIRNYESHYCDNAINEFFMLGGVSLSMSFMTIVILYTVSILIFKMKEVAPYTTRNSLRRFWKEDLAITRNFNRTNTGDEDFRGSILREINASGNVEEIRDGLDQDYVFRQVNKRMGGSGGKAALEEFKLYFENNKQQISEPAKESKSKAMKKAFSTLTTPFQVSQKGDGQNLAASSSPSALTQTPDQQQQQPFDGQRGTTIRQRQLSAYNQNATPVPPSRDQNQNPSFPKSTEETYAYRRQGQGQDPLSRPSAVQPTPAAGYTQGQGQYQLGATTAGQDRRQLKSFSLPTMAAPPRATGPSGAPASPRTPASPRAPTSPRAPASPKR